MDGWVFSDLYVKFRIRGVCLVAYWRYGYGVCVVLNLAVCVVSNLAVSYQGCVSRGVLEIRIRSLCCIESCNFVSGVCVSWRVEILAVVLNLAVSLSGAQSRISGAHSAPREVGGDG